MSSLLSISGLPSIVRERSSYMSRADHPISGAPRPTGRWLLGGLALAVVLIVAVVLLAGGSSDEPKLTVTNGTPYSAGFPLRGNLARDSAAIRAAADAWLAQDARKDGNRVLDHDDDVEMRALWAGRLHGTKAVILASNHHAALVERESGNAFSVGVTPIRDADNPVIVAFGGAILVDTQADPVFRPAVAGGPEMATLDGLWATVGPDADPDLNDGALVLRGGVHRYGSSGDRTVPAVVVVSNPSSTWLIDAALQAKLMPGEQTFSSPEYQRLVAATTPADRDNPQMELNYDPPELRLVQDRPLPVLGRTMVLTAESPEGRDRVLGRDRILAAHGGSVGKDKAEPLVLGDDRHDDGDATFGETGPPFAAAIVDRGTRQQPNRDLAVFVAGSSEIDTIEVLNGREHLTRPGPVAVVLLPPSTDDGRRKTRPRGDLAVFGHTRAGSVVVPSTVIDG